MYLLHGTDKKAAKSIVKSNCINESKFDYKEYLKSLFLKNSIRPLPKNLFPNHLMWLGKGIYFFEPSDYNLAMSWRTRYGTIKANANECCTLKIELDESVLKKTFNFSTMKGKILFKNFLENEFTDLISKLGQNKKQNEAIKMTYLKLIGLDLVKQVENISEPYALGIFSDMMIETLDNFDYSLIKASFCKQHEQCIYLETYLCLKDTRMITNIEEF